LLIDFYDEEIFDTPVEVFARKLTLFIYSLLYLPRKNKMRAFVITVICVCMCVCLFTHFEFWINSPIA